MPEIRTKRFVSSFLSYEGVFFPLELYNGYYLQFYLMEQIFRTRGILGMDSGAESLYHAEIDAFNQRMSASLTGKLAMFCGVEPLPQ